MTQRAGIHSFEVGLQIARVLAAPPGLQPLKDIAAGAGMPAAKAHRYLVSMVRSGLAEQDRETGHYRLGPLALELGLAALRDLDIHKNGAEAITDLRDTIDETVLLAVWGNKGPVVVRWVESSRPIATNVRAGWVMPLAHSATGRLFAAYLPAALTAPLLKVEFARRASERAAFEASLADIRSRGLSRVEGDLQRGISGIAAPVFGHDGSLVAVIATMGPQGWFDVSWTGPIARATLDAAHRLSRRIGNAGKSAAAGLSPASRPLSPASKQRRRA